MIDKVLRSILLSLLITIFNTLILSLIIKSPTNKDFIQYYASAIGEHSGKNPFNAKDMFELQNNLSPHPPVEKALMMWSPSWTLSLINPLNIWKNYEYSLKIWKFNSFIYLWLSVWLLFSTVLKLSDYDFKYTFVTTFISFISAPLLDVFELSQSTPIYLFGLALFCFGIVNQTPLIVGASIALWTIKPHIFTYIGVLFLFSKFFKENMVNIFLGFLLALIFLVVISELQYPGSIFRWLVTFNFDEDPNYTVRRVEWLCSNFFGFIISYFNTVGIFLSIVIPPSILIFTYILKRRNLIEIIFPDSFTWIIPVSILFSVYGWFYDQSLIIFSIAFFLLSAKTKSEYLLYSIFWLLINIYLSYYFLFNAKFQSDLWWGSLIIFLIFIPKLIRRFYRKISI